MSRKEKNEFSFEIYEKGQSFSIGEYVFSEFDDQYREEQRNTNALNDAFAVYAQEILLPGMNYPSFAEFINVNKTKLASFFNRTVNGIALITNRGQYEVHAEFLQTIKEKNQFLYELAEKLFLGSVIASFLESGLNLDAKFSHAITYYLDTQFVLRALDLQQEEETLPAMELIKLITASGGKFAILDITLNELVTNLQIAIDHFGSVAILHTIRNTSINHACARRNLTKTDLLNIQANISRALYDNFKVNTVVTPPSIIEKAKASQEHIDLQRERSRPATALHDVTCMFLIRDRRGGDIMSPQKAKHWFVTSNLQLYFFNKNKLSAGSVPEIITPEELASLLWLKDPAMFGNSLAKIGLNELIAQSLLSALPPYETLVEFDKNLRKYTTVTPQEYELIASSLATASIAKMKELNSRASDSPDTFGKEVLDIAEEEKIKRGQLEMTKDSLANGAQAFHSKYEGLLSAHSSVTGRLSDIETALKVVQEENLKIRQEKTSLLDETLSLRKQVPKKDKIIRYLSLSLLIVLLYILVTQMGIQDSIKSIMKWIIALGGLWTFGNLIFNFINFYRSTQKT